MKKTLTILIPVYNTEKYIKRCLDSVLLLEILDEIEVLVVIDGSKDGSAAIVNDYVKKYPKVIRLIEKENGGHGSTINKGIELAAGKYFKVLDSDDWFNCVDFVPFVKKLKTENADLVVTNYKQIHVYDQHDVAYKYGNLNKDTIYDFDTFDLELLKGEYFVMATSTYKLELLKRADICLLENTFYVDMQYNIEPISEVKTFIYYDLDIYRYYIGRKDQSVNVSSFVRNKTHHEVVIKHLLTFFNAKRNKLSSNKKDYVEMILNYMLNTHYTIFCEYDNDKRKAYEQIKDFDDYLKNFDEQMYLSSNKIGFIRYHRKTNFLFVKFHSKFFRKVFNFLYRIKRAFVRRGDV